MLKDEKEEGVDEDEDDEEDKGQQIIFSSPQHHPLDVSHSLSPLGELTSLLMATLKSLSAKKSKLMLAYQNIDDDNMHRPWTN